MASPPFLVTFGLTLPDSRILSGIASIGLTLANIAIILPYLRLPVLDSMQAHDRILAHEQSTQEQTNLASDIHPVDLDADNAALTSASPHERGRSSESFPCSLTTRSVRPTVADPLGCSNVEAASRALLASPAEKTGSVDGQTPPRNHHSVDAESDTNQVISNRLFAREGRAALYIPLPVPDAAEVAFFDTEDHTLFNHGLGEEFPAATCEQHSVLEEHSTRRDVPVVGKDVRLVVAGLSSTQGGADINDDPTCIVMPVTGEKTAPTPTNVIVQDQNGPVTEGTASHLPESPPARGDTVQNVREKHSLAGEKEVLAKRRPESLEFIPQSVIRRYPSAPMARRCFGHQTGQDSQTSLVPLHIFVQNPALLLEGARPRAAYTTLERQWGAPFLNVHPKQSVGGQSFVIKMAPAQTPLKEGSATLLDPPTIHELTPPGKLPTHRRRLGVLARAALRDRRASRHRNDGSDGSSESDSDSDFDNDSQYSTGSSEDKSRLPHMLGTDLIAAIDANSESELNLVGPKMAMRAPLDAYVDLLVSEDSAADVSMIMHVSSNDDTSDGEIRAPATFRSLNYEDIQQWASGVVQKCVRQVCHSRALVEPSSPSQTSDVCAEKPSGSGVSQCPLSGLHCKLGAVASAEALPRTKELHVSAPPTFVLPSRKPLSGRNLRDIPEFVPRQRQVSMITGRIEETRRFGARSTVDVTRDAATRVIARMESQAGFSARQWLVGTGEGRMVSTAGGRQGTLRCA